MKLIFEWSEEKANINFQKHKIHFKEAKTIFADPFLITFSDSEHSDNEFRYLSIGVDLKGRILVLVHTERNGNIRIINCRKATVNERRAYEERYN